MKFSREIKKKVTLSSQLYSREKNSILKKKKKKECDDFHIHKIPVDDVFEKRDGESSCFLVFF